MFFIENASLKEEYFSWVSASVDLFEQFVLKEKNQDIQTKGFHIENISRGSNLLL